MERICFKLRIKPDRIEEYKERHRNVWPEMLRAIHNAGWRNYSLFLDDDSMLIGYLETENLQTALTALTRTEINLLWQREMADFFIDLEGGRPDQDLHQLEQGFYSD